MKKTNLISVAPGKSVHLKDLDTKATGAYSSKTETLERLPVLAERLGELQTRLFAENKRSLLVVLQAMDTGGKDGAARRLFTGIDPAGIHVSSFKAPTTLELEHDFLWRVHAAVPPRGVIGVWNRSHYEDVLITRVHGLIDKEVAHQRFAVINDFERMLDENGVTIVKFFLHISKKEQKERLQARLDNPQKTWKFNVADLKERALWSDYQHAYEAALCHCSTAVAPWHIVPADHKWARDIAICEKVVETLEKMNPQFPSVDFDPKSIIIE